MEDRIRKGQEAYDLGLRLGKQGPVAIGAGGGTLAAALARCVGCGVALAGEEARFHDGSCAACGVWLAEYYSLPSAVFVRQEGSEIRLHISEGLATGSHTTGLFCTGRWDLITGADSGWAARRMQGRRGMTVCAEGLPALKLLLERMGCDVLDRPAQGLPVLRGDPEGFSLTVRWNGRVECPPGKDVLDAAVHWLVDDHAVPAFKPELI